MFLSLLLSLCCELLLCGRHPKDACGWLTCWRWCARQDAGQCFFWPVGSCYTWGLPVLGYIVTHDSQTVVVLLRAAACLAVHPNPEPVLALPGFTLVRP